MKTIIEQYDYFELWINPTAGIKSPCIVGKKGNQYTPVAYFRKPKNITKKQFDIFLRSMDIRIFNDINDGITPNFYRLGCVEKSSRNTK